MKEHMNFIQRVTKIPKKWELALWWVFRIMMIIGIFLPLWKDKLPFLSFSKEIPFAQNVLQMGANTLAMFLWEIFMMFPKKSFLRQIPTYIQDVSVPFIFCTAFCGAYLSFYYSIWWWDSFLHTLGGLLGVICGYEFLCAMQKRDKTYCNLPIMLFAAFGFCFVFGNLWELFEFTYDQIALGDSQHWSIELAQEGYRTLFPSRDPGRFALMDTMGDMVCNTVGSVVGYIFLKIFPYHHKGKHDLNALYPQKDGD
ncbi:MAG: hypothetical protein K6C36_06760 [Clostridia bacterium]|nr:hypothetical protein [Clostridia bacterium]